MREQLNKLAPRLLILDPAADPDQARTTVAEFGAGDRHALLRLCEQFNLPRKAMVPIFGIANGGERLTALSGLLDEMGVPADA